MWCAKRHAKRRQQERQSRSLSPGDALPSPGLRQVADSTRGAHLQGERVLLFCAGLAPSTTTHSSFGGVEGKGGGLTDFLSSWRGGRLTARQPLPLRHARRRCGARLLTVLLWCRYTDCHLRLLLSARPLRCPLPARSDLARDMGQTDYTAPDTSTSIQASAGGGSCAKFCLWGKGGKAYHPPAGEIDAAPVAFL